MTKLICSSFSVRRFTFDETLPDNDQLLALMEAFSDNLIGSPKADGDANFQPVHNVMGKFVTKEDLFVNDVMAFVYAKCKRRATAGVIELEFQKKLKEHEGQQGKEIKLTSKYAKDLKSHVKEECNLTAMPEFKFYPVIIDMSAKVGYVFTTSETIYNEVTDQLTAMFNFRVSDLENYEDNAFATWLWWRMENNPNKEVMGAQIVHNGEVEVFNPNSAGGGREVVNCKTSDCEECRFALMRGFETVKLSTAFVFDSVTRIVTFKGPMLVTFKDVMTAGFKDNELIGYYDLRAGLEEIYKMIHSLKNEFEDEGGIPAEVRDSWIRKDFCSRSFEDDMDL